MRRHLLIALVLTPVLMVSPLVQHVLAEDVETTEHMEVEATDTCDGCHAEFTPEVHEQWFASKHGLLNVKCFVCHGSTGEDFVRTPVPARCVGCHFAKVESLEDGFMEGRECFSCHPPHRLSPHMLSEEGGGS